MGAFLEKPKTEKINETGSGNGVRYGLSSMQGWRVEMEDAHCAVTGLQGNLANWSFFAVFDGHAGARVSAYCATQLLDAITSTDDFKKLDPTSSPSLEEIRRGIRDGFLNLDAKMRDIPEVQNGEDKSGSTAVCVLISPSHVFFANCGDSRGVLLRDGKVEVFTQDHKPVNPGEKERIQNAGGSVMIQRVNGSLAVSRSLGDYDYKNVAGRGPTEQLVSPEPEVTIVDRDPSKDEFVVLACDGIWDVMSNEDICDFVRHRAQVQEDLSLICNEVVDTCLHKGSRDNMSVVLIAFDGAPSTDADKKAKEVKVNTLITSSVTDILKNYPETDINTVLSKVQDIVDPSDLPPGGGIAAKRQLVEELYKKLCPDKHKENESS